MNWIQKLVSWGKKWKFIVFCLKVTKNQTGYRWISFGTIWRVNFQTFQRNFMWKCWTKMVKCRSILTIAREGFSEFTLGESWWWCKAPIERFCVFLMWFDVNEKAICSNRQRDHWAIRFYDQQQSLMNFNYGNLSIRFV